jgi:hypothetical protein
MADPSKQSYTYEYLPLSPTGGLKWPIPRPLRSRLWQTGLGLVALLLIGLTTAVVILSKRAPIRSVLMENNQNL